MCSLPSAWYRAAISAPVLLATLFLIPARMPLAFLPSWALLAPVHQLLISTPRSFSAQQLFSHSSLHCCLWLEWSNAQGVRFNPAGEEIGPRQQMPVLLHFFPLVKHRGKRDYGDPLQLWLFCSYWVGGSGLDRWAQTAHSSLHHLHMFLVFFLVVLQYFLLLLIICSSTDCLALAQISQNFNHLIGGNNVW